MLPPFNSFIIFDLEASCSSSSSDPQSLTNNLVCSPGLAVLGSRQLAHTQVLLFFCLIQAGQGHVVGRFWLDKRLRLCARLAARASGIPQMPRSQIHGLNTVYSQGCKTGSRKTSSFDHRSLPSLTPKGRGHHFFPYSGMPFTPAKGIPAAQPKPAEGRHTKSAPLTDQLLGRDRRDSQISCCYQRPAWLELAMSLGGGDEGWGGEGTHTRMTS